MYIPAHFAASDDVVRDLLTNCGAADLITSTADGLLATFLPFVFEPDAGEHGALLGHVARNNPQWRTAVLGDALVVVHGPDAYVSPSWYATTAEHGRVVPTWNYVTAHVYGELVVHDNPVWVDALVRRLTERQLGSGHPWSVDDAPSEYISRELRAIVGLEVTVKRIEAKAKLSQNRPAADIQRVIQGLEARGEIRSAAAVRSTVR